jgi:hypothetical protein
VTFPGRFEDARYEVKFVGPATQRHVLERWLSTHPSGFFEPYPPRQVSSVYFDTYDCAAYEQNLVGASERQKLRFRWYGDDETRGRGALELKLRRNRLGWKVVHPVDGIPLDASWTEIRSKLRSQLPPKARLWLELNPLPVLISRYHRRYFVSADRRLRVTVDKDLRLFDQRLRRSPNLLRRSRLPESVVIEFKCGAADRQIVASAIQGLPLRASRHSKYVVGVQALVSE